MFYCKYCSDTLQITKNINLSIEDKIKPINDVKDLIKIVLEEEPETNIINSDFQYSINWPESNILEYKYDNNLNNEEFKQKLFNKYRKIIKSQKNISKFYLACSNCETTYFLEPETLLYSINFEKSALNIDENILIRNQDPLLPRTKDFICPNVKCVNNVKQNNKKVMMEKEAVIYRMNKEYNIKYICCQCNSQWGT